MSASIKSRAASRNRRPVSCRFCRSRKLRCSREFPCSNCVSRGIQCEQDEATEITRDTSNVSDSALLDRIRRLEETVKSQQQESRKRLRTSSPDASSHTLEQPNVTDVANIERDVAWLEGIYSNQDASDQLSSSEIVFKLCSAEIIPRMQPYLHERTSDSYPEYRYTRCIWLPYYHQAKILLDKFMQDIEHLHHVMHGPSLPSILDDTYSCLSSRSQINSGNMLLLLGIFTSATNSWLRQDSVRGLFLDHDTANRQALMWAKTVEDVVDVAHRTASVSIEGLQGMIITSFVLLNIEGLSRRCKSIYNTALLLARDLGLHCIDHPSNQDTAHLARAEMGRRAWWYLVASDWSLAARFNNMAQGVYQCNVRHMMVNKPLNIDDDEITDGMDLIGHPMSRPTEMSYSLMRLRVAEVSRNIVDRAPLVMARAEGPSHTVVMDIDSEIQILLHEVPPYFRMTLAELMSDHNLSAARAAKIFYQGYTFHALLYALRCKLHLRFFARGFADSTFSSSRDLCLLSARCAIQEEVRMEKSGVFVATRYKLCTLALGVFMASIVLLVDLCHHKGSTPHRERQRSEVADAFRILEQARNESKIVGRFIDSLTHIMKKHKIQPLDTISTVTTTSAIPNINERFTTRRIISEMPRDEQQMLTPSSEVVYVDAIITDSQQLASHETDSRINDYVNPDVGDEATSSYFNLLAQDLERGVDIGEFDWDNIFSGLNSSFA